MSAWKYTARSNGKVRLCSLTFRLSQTSQPNSFKFESAKVNSVSVDSKALRKRSRKGQRKDVEVFTWGCGQEGALGHGAFEDLAIPKAVARLKAVVVREVACGAGHSLALSYENAVFAWGFNKVGQLGLGDFVDRSVPCLVSLPNDVRHIRSGAGHCFVLTKAGSVYSWGFSEYYQTGHNSQENLCSPTLLRYLHRIADVSCGITHSLLLTETGKVLSLGYNANGQCGVGKRCQFCPSPEEVVLETPVKMVAAGGAHSLFLAVNGTVYACGLNTSGQCSVKAEVLLSPEPVVMQDSGQLVTESCKYLEGIKSIEAGEETSAAITLDGQLYVWGWNGCGQLGQGHFKNLSGPTLLPTDEEVKAVSCGVCQVAYITASGQLFKTGWEGERSTFLKTPRAALVSKVFGAEYSVRLVCCGRTHIVASVERIAFPEPIAERRQRSFAIDDEKPSFSSKSAWKNHLTLDKEPNQLLPLHTIHASQSTGSLKTKRIELYEDLNSMTLHSVPLKRKSKKESTNIRSIIEQREPVRELKPLKEHKPVMAHDLKQSEAGKPSIEKKHLRGEKQSVEEKTEERQKQSTSLPSSEKKAKKDRVHRFLEQELVRYHPPSDSTSEFEVLKAKIAIVDSRIQSKQKALMTKTSRTNDLTGSPAKRTGGGYFQAISPIKRWC